MSTVRAVLIGLPSDHHLIPPDIQPIIAKGLAAVHTQMGDAGIQYEFNAVSPEEGLAELGSKLQSQNPDVVVIGNGIRGNMDLTPFMEQIIDIIRTSVPQARVAFNTLPDNSVDAVKRNSPAAKSA